MSEDLNQLGSCFCTMLSGKPFLEKSHIDQSLFNYVTRDFLNSCEFQKEMPNDKFKLVKSHAIFQDLNWCCLSNKTLKSPQYNESLSSNHSHECCEDLWQEIKNADEFIIENENCIKLECKIIKD